MPQRCPYCHNVTTKGNGMPYVLRKDLENKGLRYCRLCNKTSKDK